MKNNEIKHDGKVTVYTRSPMGIVKTEGKNLEIKVRPYAQYKAAVEVRFIPKGKRKVQGFVQTYEPSVLVLEGWDHPEPDGMIDPASVRVEGGVRTSMSRYLSCDPRWESDFRAMITPYIEKIGDAKVLADFKGHNPNEAR